MSWVLFGLFSSVFAAGMPEINRRFKLDSIKLNFWRTTVSTVIMLPLIPWMHWPKPSLFYFAVACYATLVLISMIIIMNMAAKQNGRVASMFMPIKAFAAFALWVLIEPGAWHHFIESPLRAGTIIVSFAVMLFAMQALRRNDVGWRAFVAMAPVGVMLALVDIASRLGIAGHDLIPTALTFMFLNYVFSTILSGTWLLSVIRADKKIYSPVYLKAGSIAGVMHIFLMFSGTMCIVLAPNPAYFSLIQMLVPVYLMLYHKLAGIEDDASPRIGGMMVIAAMIMIWATTL